MSKVFKLTYPKVIIYGTLTMGKNKLTKLIKNDTDSISNRGISTGSKYNYDIILLNGRRVKILDITAGQDVYGKSDTVDNCVLINGLGYDLQERTSRVILRLDTKKI